jgi:hypothetical protein
LLSTAIPTLKMARDATWNEARALRVDVTIAQAALAVRIKARMASHYTKSADREALAAAAMSKLSRKGK